MVNYVEAYKAGLNSAELSEKRKNEINSVFNDLNQQLSDATDGKIFISRKKLLDRSGFAAFDLFNRKYYSAITAENPLVKNSEKELAKWSQDRSGYPCKITLDSDAMYCEDKQGLEISLYELLSDPIIGETLQKLQNLPIPEKVGTEASANSISSDDTDHAGSEG